MGKTLTRPSSSSSAISSYDALRHELLRAVSGDRKCLAFPEQITYRSASVGCNLDIAVKPTVITFPKRVEHVQEIVKVASLFNLHVQARSGGHSYGNYGMRSRSTAVWPAINVIQVWEAQMAPS
jgi:hypothetical protein